MSAPGVIDAQVGRWVWPAVEHELAVAIVAGRPALVIQQARDPKGIVLYMEPQMCEALAEALEAAADIATGVVRRVDVDPGPVLG